jgi:hypothetical protein
MAVPFSGVQMDNGHLTEYKESTTTGAGMSRPRAWRGLRKIMVSTS